ncbi:MAG: aldehyde ferredoxin oxidoreductase family protein [Anaerolineae bacterium]
MHWREFGTAGHILMSQEAGCLPTRNYQSGVFEQAEAISGEAMRESGLVVKNKACLGCTIGCGVWSRVGDLSVDGPEYETLAMLGSNCGIARLEAVARANWLCDDLGIDTISTGNIIAFTMECYERGIIGDEETGGLALRFGDETAYFRLMEMIARREGIGDILAEGVRQAARHFRKGAERIAMHSKGLEQSGYETRGGIGQVLGYAVVDRGADHNRIWSMGFFTGNRRYSPGGKAEMVKRIQCNRSAPDLMGQCRFVSYYVDFDDYATLITAATGRPSTGQDIRRTAERVFNLTRVFNIREGYTRADDHVPPRVFEEPVPDGPAAGHRVDRAEFEALLDEFYALSGWDRDGVPTQATLLALDLPDVAADLEAMGRA